MASVNERMMKLGRRQQPGLALRAPRTSLAGGPGQSAQAAPAGMAARASAGRPAVFSTPAAGRMPGAPAALPQAGPGPLPPPLPGTGMPAPKPVTPSAPLSSPFSPQATATSPVAPAMPPEPTSLLSPDGEIQRPLPEGWIGANTGAPEIPVVQQPQDPFMDLLLALFLGGQQTAPRMF